MKEQTLAPAAWPSAAAKADLVGLRDPSEYSILTKERTIAAVNHKSGNLIKNKPVIPGDASPAAGE